MIVIATVDLAGVRAGLRKFDRGRATEFAAPNHQRFFEQTALLQVPDQRRAGAVHVAALLRKLIEQVVSRPGAVNVPAPVVELHVAHAAFYQPARQQTVVRKTRLARFRAVHLMDVLRFFGNVEHLGHRNLQRVERLDAVRRQRRAAHRVD